MAYDWLLEDLTVCDSANWGIQVDSGWRVLRCDLRRLGTMGLGGGGNPQTLIEDCDVGYCNTTDADSHWEAGGMKFVYSNGLTVRRCWVHDNGGPGIWFDGHSTDAQIVGNTVEDNDGPGIDYEINRGALIEGNECRRNGSDPTWADDYDLGGGGIYVIDCADVTIRNNIVEDNQGGIGLVDDAREGRANWPPLENVEVCGNRIRYAQRKTGVAIASGRPPLATSVRFRDNRYEIDPARQGFRVGDVSMSFPAWQARWPSETLYQEPPAKPAKPAGLAVSRDLHWEPDVHAPLYRVEMKSADGWLPVAETHQYHLLVVRRGRYRVRAENQSGVSPWATVIV